MVIYVFTFSSQKYSVKRIALPTAAMCIELPANLPKHGIAAIACEMNTRLQYNTNSHMSVKPCIVLEHAVTDHWESMARVRGLGVMSPPRPSAAPPFGELF